MEPQLWTVRVKSFLYSLAGILVTALSGALLSDEFRALVSEYAGTSIVGTLIMLIVTEGLKHLRNVTVLGKARRLYGSEHTGSGSVELI